MTKMLTDVSRALQSLKYQPALRLGQVLIVFTCPNKNLPAQLLCEFLKSLEALILSLKDLFHISLACCI